MAATSEDAKAALADAERIHSATAVDEALDRMADDLTRHYRDRDPVLVCVMTGGLIPAGHLLTRLEFPLQLDYVHATRYQGSTEGGDLEWMAGPNLSLEGRDVILVDDILDGGWTLATIKDHLLAQGAASVACAVLVSKRIARQVDIEAEYVGLEVEDRYVFGFGMDYEEYHRNLRGIYAL
ncbi:hypoxanthine phosphoribosyltransferase [Thiohalospira halophila DSM 15071]|uniref:Hypoxanthine phosphoribosyltransferase n=1 Tax=Thiohalospira halophila DSM 15071 TaxID=1123397 RepID=A0A1I1P2A6_9GAMM|nr:hypoxanthine-guanine phosphoribosyltransferase [Thiohalospira halophila]SFD03969.1 hypoxanthine phosphoribosyltransferase [Thiohalospira halophila DSM 15071]